MAIFFDLARWVPWRRRAPARVLGGLSKLRSAAPSIRPAESPLALSGAQAFPKLLVLLCWAPPRLCVEARPRHAKQQRRKQTRCSDAGRDAATQLTRCSDAGQPKQTVVQPPGLPRQRTAVVADAIELLRPFLAPDAMLRPWGLRATRPRVGFGSVIVQKSKT